MGGGAAGFFGAIACAERAGGADVAILEKTAQVLQKVRISGGGRCNVTHSCFDARELTRSYPRGERELIGPFHQFQPDDTLRWFESRGVKLKTEADGRMFPTTDSSETIVNCLLDAARRAGVRIRLNAGVQSVAREGEGFQLVLASGESVHGQRLLLATGGCRSHALGQLAVSLGHTLREPVPSLFTFHVAEPWVQGLAGISLPQVEVSVPDLKLNSAGPLLFTHWGLSGPAILRLSAWGARKLHERDYQFRIQIRWLPGASAEAVRSVLTEHARVHGAKRVANSAPWPFPNRFWQALTAQARLPSDKRWSTLTRPEQQTLIQALTATELAVSGKSLNKDEFVTCGGVALNEVNFKTMESKICPHLYFAGELLDIDGITGGFNFQAAWTTGWIAGVSIAASLG